MEILFPVGRMIGGSLYKPQTRTDNAGKPKIDTATGQPETYINFGVAIPKGAEQHWAHTEWGGKIYQIAAAAYPQMVQNPTFAWKIIDGDSQIPNKKGRKPCEQEGYPGHWVLWFSQSWAPQIVNANGTQQLTEPDAVVPGYYVQVFGSVKGNAPSPSPGVYLNPIAVALAGYGQRIETSSVDTTAVGFGTGPAPVGMSTVPLAAMTAPPAAPGAAVPGMVPPPIPQAGGILPSPAMPTPPVAAAVPPPIAPVPGFVTGPAAAPPPAPARVMLPAANGIPYESYIAKGWTDDMLRQNGMMQ